MFSDLLLNKIITLNDTTKTVNKSNNVVEKKGDGLSFLLNLLTKTTKTNDIQSFISELADNVLSVLLKNGLSNIKTVFYENDLCNTNEVLDQSLFQFKSVNFDEIDLFGLYKSNNDLLDSNDLIFKIQSVFGQGSELNVYNLFIIKSELSDVKSFKIKLHPTLQNKTIHDLAVLFFKAFNFKSIENIFLETLKNIFNTKHLEVSNLVTNILNTPVEQVYDDSYFNLIENENKKKTFKYKQIGCDVIEIPNDIYFLENISGQTVNYVEVLNKFENHYKINNLPFNKKIFYNNFINEFITNLLVQFLKPEIVLFAKILDKFSNSQTGLNNFYKNNRVLFEKILSLIVDAIITFLMKKIIILIKDLIIKNNTKKIKELTQNYQRQLFSLIGLKA